MKITTVKLELDSTDKILLKRSLNQNGKGQRFFTHEVRRLSDPYVPFYKGPLKNTVIEKPKSITHVQPYSAKQWYTNAGKSKGKRGRMWTLRMWADRKQDIIKSVAKFCGGKAK